MATEDRSERPARFAIHAMVVVGGMAALSWEVLWQLRSTLALGASALGTSITLAATMGGMAVGAVLAGSSDFIDQAWRWKQRIGGSMRQAGIIAAAGVYALDHHVERMAEDHENAKLLATRLAAVDGLGVEPEHVDTNIVIIDVSASGSDAPTWSQRLGEEGVRLSPIGLNTLRALTHLDVTRSEVEQAADVFKRLAEGELAAA